MNILVEVTSDPQAYALLPRVISVFFYFIVSLIILADMRAYWRYTRVVATVVGVEAKEEMMHDMAGATHTEYIPEIEFRTTENKHVRLKIYETLLKSLSPGNKITVYYSTSKKDGSYTLYFPFSRAKFLLILLFSVAAFFLWEAATW
jgi:hypothetical protein